MMSGIFLSQDDLASLSDEARAEILHVMLPTIDGGDDDWDRDVVRLSPAQAQEFLLNCSDKTRAILQLFVENEGEVAHREVGEMFGETAAQLKSAWGGLTKRTKTVTGLKKAKLVEWDDSDGEWIAYMRPETVASLSDALNPPEAKSRAGKARL